MTKVRRIKLSDNEYGAEIRVGPEQELLSVNKYKWQCDNCKRIYGYRMQALECANLHEQPEITVRLRVSENLDIGAKVYHNFKEFGIWECELVTKPLYNSSSGSYGYFYSPAHYSARAKVLRRIKG